MSNFEIFKAICESPLGITKKDLREKFFNGKASDFSAYLKWLLQEGLAVENGKNVRAREGMFSALLALANSTNGAGSKVEEEVKEEAKKDENVSVGTIEVKAVSYPIEVQDKIAEKLQNNNIEYIEVEEIGNNEKLPNNAIIIQQPLVEEVANNAVGKKSGKGGIEGWENEITDKSFLPIVAEWIEYKKERKTSYKNVKSVKRFYDLLVKLSNGNLRDASEIVSRSMGNNYMGIYELRHLQKNTTNNAPQTGQKIVSDSNYIRRFANGAIMVKI